MVMTMCRWFPVWAASDQRSMTTWVPGPIIPPLIMPPDMGALVTMCESAPKHPVVFSIVMPERLIIEPLPSIIVNEKLGGTGPVAGVTLVVAQVPFTRAA